MRSFILSFLLPSVVLALAKPRALLARQAVGPACDNEAAQDGTACLGFNTVQAASFCSLTLTIPTKTRTITETSVYEFTVTSFSPLITETATPPVTTSITLLTTFNTTAFANQTTVLSSGTQFVATTTVGVTDTLTQYTCGLPSSFSGQPSPVALAGNLRPKVLPAAVYAAATTTPTIPLPSCFPSFINEYGQKGVTSACNCYGVYGPTFTSTEVQTVTQTSVSIVTTVVPGTTTITPVNTATYFNTSTQIETVTSIITNQVPLFPNATSTAASRTTVTVSTTSPRPTSNFHLFLTIPSLPFFPPQYAYAVNTTDDSGTVITFSPNEINADTFALDPQLRLIDRSEGGEFTAINSKDVYPWFYLDSVAETNNTALCFTCGQSFSCTLPGRTQEQVWAVCDGYLALGPASTFVQTRDCVVVELGFNLGVA